MSFATAQALSRVQQKVSRMTSAVFYTAIVGLTLNAQKLNISQF